MLLLNKINGVILRMRKKTEQKDILKYQKGGQGQALVKRHYLNWRKKQSIPYRCDIPECTFHTAPLEWMGEKLALILDHINGVRGDNRPQNLRFMCPNCNSIQPTHGGRNKGKFGMDEGGFWRKNELGKKSYVLPIETMMLNLTMSDKSLSK